MNEALKRCFPQIKTADPFFIVVGANDGRDHYHWYIQRWQGIQIEPIPEYFELLKQNCGSRHILEQVAVSNYDGIGTLYQADIDKIRQFKQWMKNDPNYLRYVSSFDKAHLIAHCPWLQRSDDFIIEIEVEVTTIPSLLNKHGVKKIDYLQIDAEGADFDILMGVEFYTPPSLILVEHKHMTEFQKAEVTYLLESYGYFVESFTEDFLAQHSTVFVPPPSR